MFIIFHSYVQQPEGLLMMWSGGAGNVMVLSCQGPRVWRCLPPAASWWNSWRSMPSPWEASTTRQCCSAEGSHVLINAVKRCKYQVMGKKLYFYSSLSGGWYSRPCLPTRKVPLAGSLSFYILLWFLSLPQSKWLNKSSIPAQPSRECVSTWRAIPYVIL